MRKRTRNWWKVKVFCGGKSVGKKVRPGGGGDRDGGDGVRVLSCIIL